MAAGMPPSSRHGSIHGLSVFVLTLGSQINIDSRPAKGAEFVIVIREVATTFSVSGSNVTPCLRFARRAGRSTGSPL